MFKFIYKNPRINVITIEIKNFNLLKLTQQKIKKIKGKHEITINRRH